jgi:uncharacterized integral membrane protein
MSDDMDWRDGSVQRTMPDSAGFEWSRSRSRSRGRRRARRHIPWTPLVVLVVIVVGIVLWLENRSQVHLKFLSVHVTAPLWVVAVVNLAIGLLLGGVLVARSRR